ncbi:aldo/keto reductase [Pseudomonas sp. LAIL14HWK12:I10]|uniref:aldo/keto reductase n=1 Tax=unclassified Pseudomonas TaxID=196821 RepID=UPI0004806A01|nr:aldo/keto reductase [Pseudomonas sp. LAIL14HWK12:I10]SMF27240.1 2,5-diketo-D-gluconate reductase A [Pseudomonas sp. LAIL14HWK12:I11]SMR73994.1 2,5-diketo-D-gluconate reductase A [Pseudomonas sp. LAIL14HWK12:I10]SOD03998.1 2,5-diketo-D-gluconate reductase A [Pseudomonas sp. LAIL14HWK12:I8]
MTNHQPMIELSDGNLIPQLGLGVWQASQGQARTAVSQALQIGYRHIDTASIYENEEGVGAGLRDSGVDRERVFVTTKIWNADQGFEASGKALDESLARLKLEYVDLLLIHWPAPAKGLFLDTWKAMIEAKKQGKARSIGVSNFNPDHLKQLIEVTGVAPVLNQIELHPYFQQADLRRSNAELGIRTESWSPLAQGKAIDDPLVREIAAKHDRTCSQVIIRWHLQLGLVVIPKSVTEARIRENHRVFDFELSADEIGAIAALDREQRLGPDPVVLG